MRSVLLIVTLLAGCGANAGREALQDTVRVYNSQVRWMQWAGAARFVDPELRQDWLNAHTAHGETLRITDLTVNQVQQVGDGQEATVTIGVSWYRLPTMNLQFTAWEQRWKLVEGAWLMVKETPIEASAPKSTEVKPWP